MVFSWICPFGFVFLLFFSFSPTVCRPNPWQEGPGKQSTALERKMRSELQAKRRLFCRRARAGLLIYCFSSTFSMGRCKKNGSGVDKHEQRDSKELEAIWEGEFFTFQQFGRDKRRAWTRKRRGNNADLLRSLFSTQKCTNAADIAEWFPAALWLHVELQPSPAWDLTSPCRSTQTPANPCWRHPHCSLCWEEGFSNTFNLPCTVDPRWIWGAD